MERLTKEGIEEQIEDIGKYMECGWEVCDKSSNSGNFYGLLKPYNF